MNTKALTFRLTTLIENEMHRKYHDACMLLYLQVVTFIYGTFNITFPDTSCRCYLVHLLLLFSSCRALKSLTDTNNRRHPVRHMFQVWDERDRGHFPQH